MVLANYFIELDLLVYDFYAVITLFLSITEMEHSRNIKDISVIYNLSESIVAGVRELSSQSQLLSLLRTQDTRDTKTK